MINKKIKKHIINSLEKKAQKILDSKYDKKDAVLRDRFMEINTILGGENTLSEKEFSELIERGIEPVMHIYGHCFLVSYFENHTFGIANFNTKKMILPCEFSEISFDSSQKINDGLLVYATDIFDETSTYLIKDNAHLMSNNFAERSVIIQNIAKKHNFTTSVDITKADKIVV